MSDIIYDMEAPENSKEAILDVMVKIISARTSRFGFPYEKVETWPRDLIEWAFCQIVNNAENENPWA